MTDQEKINEATALIHNTGGIDGSHHKQWVIDQVLRILTGEKYDEWINDYNDPEYPEWDQGVAP